MTESKIVEFVILQENPVITEFNRTSKTGSEYMQILVKTMVYCNTLKENRTLVYWGKNHPDYMQGDTVEAECEITEYDAGNGIEKQLVLLKQRGGKGAKHYRILIRKPLAEPLKASLKQTLEFKGAKRLPDIARAIQDAVEQADAMAFGHTYQPGKFIYRASSASSLLDCMRRAFWSRNYKDVLDSEQIEMIEETKESVRGVWFGANWVGSSIHEAIQLRLDYLQRNPERADKVTVTLESYEKTVGIIIRVDGSTELFHEDTGIEEVENQIKLHLKPGDFAIMGHYDLLLGIGQGGEDYKRYVVDIKTYNSKWGTTYNNKEGHQAQLAVMAKCTDMKGEPLDAILWYVGRNSGENDFYSHPWEPQGKEQFDKIIKLYRILAEHERKMSTPPRLHQYVKEGHRKGKPQMDNYPCDSSKASPPYRCEFFEICWGKGNRAPKRVMEKPVEEEQSITDAFS